MSAVRGDRARCCASLASGDYAFILLNFANPDMVGHTGVMAAAIKAVETIDRCLERVCEAVLARGGAVLITADHGNCEQMVDPVTGEPHTAHTTNPVPSDLGGERSRAGGACATAASRTSRRPCSSCWVCRCPPR